MGVEMERIGIGIIGLGIGRAHLRAYQKNPAVSLRAICDLDPKVIAEIKQSFGLRDVFSCANYEELLNRKDVDAVSVCLPNYLHAKVSIAALRSGKHVLCEKPMVINMEECQDLVKVVKESKGKFMCGHEVRFTPLFQTVKKLIAEGELGIPFFCESDYLDDKKSMMHGWRKDAEKVGSWLLEAGCHPIDLLRWLIGDIAEVTGYSNRKAEDLECPTDDCVVAALKFENGCIGRFGIAVGRKGPYNITLSVYGTRGTYRNGSIFLEKIYGLKDFMPLGIPTLNFHCFEAEINHFIDCIMEGKEPLVDVSEGAKTIATCLAIQEALDEGKSIQVKNDFSQ